MQCLPFVQFFSLNDDYAIKYSDFSEEGWTHISCVIDQKQGVIRGSLYNLAKDGSVSEHGYVKDAKAFIHMFSLLQESKNDKFTVYLNSDEN